MTKKHLQLLAKAFRESRPDSDTPEYKQWITDIEAIGSVCSSVNSRFKTVKFYMSCGVWGKE